MAICTKKDVNNGVDKFLEIIKAAGELSYTKMLKILLFIVGTFCPGILFIFVYKKDLFLKLDYIKLLLLSISLTLPLVLLNSILIFFYFFKGDILDKRNEEISIQASMIYTAIELYISLTLGKIDNDIYSVYFLVILFEGVIILSIIAEPLFNKYKCLKLKLTIGLISIVVSCKGLSELWDGIYKNKEIVLNLKFIIITIIMILLILCGVVTAVSNYNKLKTIISIILYMLNFVVTTFYAFYFQCFTLLILINFVFSIILVLHRIKKKELYE